MERKKTNQIKVGDVLIGGGSPVSIQSMTSGYTYEIDTCVAEINRLHIAGADIVRVAVPQKADTAALPEILNQVTVPIVADVHFHYQRALESIAAGALARARCPAHVSQRSLCLARNCWAQRESSAGRYVAGF